MSVLTYKFRIKDASQRKRLSTWAYGCNQIWNYCCQIQREAQARWKAGGNTKWPTHFDLVKLCTGASADLGIHSDTMNKICAQFVASRNHHNKCPKFRASGGPKKALGLVPVVPRAFRVDGASITYLRRKLHFWKSREIPENIKCGAFVQDASGKWFVTFACEVPDDLPTGNGAVGIDLGLKSIAALSSGEVIENPRHVAKYTQRLATAQRAGNKKRTRAINAKIGNSRKHHLHEWSARIARENEFIVVGDVSPSKLIKTRMAKSVLDAGWAMFKSQLAYKARRHGARFMEADERFTTQACSECGSISGPKGIAGLGIRSWECGCGAIHDRDVNSAKNILRFGQEHLPLAVGSPA